MIAALFVMKDGPYFGLDGIDPWDESRDARKYAGPHPVIAHPPCQRWGRYWSGGPSVKVPKLKGDDAGCFDRALWAVRNFGGVLEHPAHSEAWKYYRLGTPEPKGWTGSFDGHGNWVCQVHQGHYGHPADKATWLYVNAPRPLPDLIWGPCEGKLRMDEGFHSTEERRLARARGVIPLERLSARDRLATPEPFKDLLFSIARSA